MTIVRMGASQYEMKTPRPLWLYRPQHDDDCQLNRCFTCGKGPRRHARGPRVGDPDLLGKFEVVCTFRPKAGPVRQRTLAPGLASADDAAAFAEAFILAERREVTRLTDKRAKWRKDRATEGQKGRLRWLKIPYREDITKGEASALIDLAQGRQGK